MNVSTPPSLRDNCSGLQIAHYVISTAWMIVDIIRIGEQSHLPARRTLEQLGVPRRILPLG